MSETVNPIKNKTDYILLTRDLLQRTKDAKTNLRNYFMFRVGMCCVLRISDIVSMRVHDLYDADLKVKPRLTIKEIKTGKKKDMSTAHFKKDAEKYRDEVLKPRLNKNYPDKATKCLSSSETIEVGTGKNKREINKYATDWLFTSDRYPFKHVDEKAFYKAIKASAKDVNLEHIGTHTMRKTGAYLLYRGNFDDVLKDKNVKPNNNISLAMKVLNHSSQASTLRYLGLDKETLDKAINDIDAFDIEI